jgi:HTH-type transcriptional regulator / antitoxin HipB
MNTQPRDPVLPIGNMGVPIGNMALLATPEQFGAWIRRRRQALGLKQQELAFLVEVGRRFISELEAGKPTCHLGKALAVVRALGGRLVDAADPGRTDHA